MTKEQLLEQIRTENPFPQYRVDGDKKIKLTQEEYEKSLQDWVEMRLLQLAEEEKKAILEAEKSALLARLGITEQEARLLLGGN